MYIEDCVNKEIFGSFDKRKLPKNLNEYNCELCIEEYSQGPLSQEVKYFRFTPRSGIRREPFNIIIDNIAKPKNILYLYRVVEDEEKENISVTLGNRVEYKLQTTVIEPKKREHKIINQPEPHSDGEYAFHQIDEDMLRPYVSLADESLEEEYSQRLKMAENSDRPGNDPKDNSGRNEGMAERNPRKKFKGE